MATSKVKTITGVKEYDGTNGKVFYHSCNLEDGQFISIGKKTSGAVKVGDEIDYELVDGKAKVIKKAFVPGGKKGSNGGYALSYAKDIAIAKMNKGDDVTSQKVLDIADLFYNWLQSHE